jgi:CelD/BcsL family acetyltransferase involved in cellulose biosynthesis
MFLPVLELEFLETLHLPLVMLAQRRAAAAFTARAAQAGHVDVEIAAGSAALTALRESRSPAQQRGGTVFHTSALLQATAAQAQAAGDQVVIARFRRGSAVSSWPLRLTRRRGITRATDLAAPLGQYGDVLGPPFTADAFAACAAALKADHGVDVIESRRVRADSGLAAALQAAGARAHAAQAAPYIDLSAFADFSAYEAQANSHTRRNRRQRRQKLEAAHGPITFSVAPACEAPEALRTAIDWKRQWLEHQGRLSRVIDGGDNERALLRACAGENAYLSLLHVGDEFAAAELGFANGAHYAAYLGSYNPAFAAFSVGQEQMLRTIAWCFAQDFARYDLLAPADVYKLTWARGKSEPVHDYSLALSWKGAGDVFVRRHASAGARRIFDALPPGMRRHALQWRAHFARSNRR